MVSPPPQTVKQAKFLGLLRELSLPTRKWLGMCGTASHRVGDFEEQT